MVLEGVCTVSARSDAATVRLAQSACPEPLASTACWTALTTTSSMTEVPGPDHDSPTCGPSNALCVKRHVPSQRTSITGRVSTPDAVNDTPCRSMDETAWPTRNRSPERVFSLPREKSSAFPASIASAKPLPVNVSSKVLAPATVAKPTLALWTLRPDRFMLPAWDCTPTPASCTVKSVRLD